MNKFLLKKIIAWIGLIAIVANLFLFAFMVYSALVFWIVIVVVAIIAFPVMKMLNKKKK